MNKYIRTSLLSLFLISTLNVSAQQMQPANRLRYDIHTNSAVPIPPSERALQTITAVPWFKVSEQGHILEGAIFDNHGNLMFCDVTERRILRLTPDKKLSTIVTLAQFSPGGLALDSKGKLFIAALDLVNKQGTIIAVNLDGTDMQTIIEPKAGFLPNDVVFDAQDGFYFSDFSGTSTEPKGGIYYVSPDHLTITPVIPHLALANGVTLSPEGKFLWATEFGRNLLHRTELADATRITPIGSAITYHFTGPAPDSMRSDADGNIYVAMYGQGRILIFNKNGIPIGQVLLPKRDQGHNLLSTSLAIDPANNTLYAVTSDGENGEGATIFHARVFTHGLAVK